jgi:hypothetical protein
MRGPKTLLMHPFRFLLCLLATVVFLFESCATSRPRKQQEDPLIRMAAFDLDCPKEQLTFQRLGRGVFGVSGCGQRAKYVLVCREVRSGVFEDSECQWVQN